MRTLALLFLVSFESIQASGCDMLLERLTQKYRMTPTQAEVLIAQWTAAGKTEAQIAALLDSLPPLPDKASEMRTASYLKALDILSRESRPYFPEKLTPADQVALAILQREDRYHNWFVRTFNPFNAERLDLRFRKMVNSATEDQELTKFLGPYEKTRYYAVGDFLLKSSSKEELLLRIDESIANLDRSRRSGGFFRKWYLRNYKARLQSLRKIVETDRAKWAAFGTGYSQSAITDPSRRFLTAVVWATVGLVLYEGAIPFEHKVREFFEEKKAIGPLPETPLDQVPIDPEWQRKVNDGTLFDL
jgi:hypothetical protein